MLERLKLWGEIATEAGISKAELAYRWAAYHSILKERDGLIFGAKNGRQTQSTLEGLKNGPLSAEVAKKIARGWEIVRHEAPVDNFNR
jgi:aryl-alcohol dehydrogenase-like predicted oxidoreductase